MVPLPGRGPGAACVLEIGPADRAVDLVFLHATGFNALTYRHILAPLARDCRILAVDQRGHGGATLTADPGDRPDWNDYRDDVLALREVLNLEGVVVAGHSMGATVSILATASEPKFAKRLVLFDPVILPLEFDPHAGHFDLSSGAARRRAVYDNRAQVRASYRGRGAFVGWPDDMLNDYLTAGFHDLPSGEVKLACAPLWEAATYRAQRHDTRAALANLACPIDLYQAEFNSACRLDPATPGINWQIVAGAGHFLPMERPDLACAALAAAMGGMVA